MSIPTTADTDNAGRFDLLASALAGRPLRVAYGRQGERPWTDGTTVVIDPTSSDPDQLAAVTVQACLISAGSLQPDTLHSLRRRPKLAARYLAVEGHRALHDNAAVLPPALRPLIDTHLAASSTSSAASLTIAASRQPIAHPPAAFGAIRTNKVLAAQHTRDSNGDAVQHHHVPKGQPSELNEVDDEDDLADDGAGVAAEMFSVGGASGPLGKLLARLLKAVRSGDGHGSPGTDTATHLGRRSTIRRGISVLSAATAAAIDDTGAPSTATWTYPEWDFIRKRYRPDWCTVNHTDPPVRANQPLAVAPEATRLRHTLARLTLGLDRRHRQPCGDDIDIDAAIDTLVQARVSSTPDENLYIATLRRRRDLSVLVLLDISGSAGERDGHGATVHERQRNAAAVITGVLYDLGDRVALYAYNSHGRSAVNVFPVKDFDDRLDTATLQRLHSLTPGAYSRLGAAIRHGAAMLETRGGTTRRLLIVLSDGLAYDHGYDKEHGAADSRRALAEARRGGTGALCLTFGTTANAASLQRVFGSAAHATVTDHNQLTDAVSALARTALRSADVRKAG